MNWPRVFEHRACVLPVCVCDGGGGAGVAGGRRPLPTVSPLRRPRRRQCVLRVVLCVSCFFLVALYPHIFHHSSSCPLVCVEYRPCRYLPADACVQINYANAADAAAGGGAPAFAADAVSTAPQWFVESDGVTGNALIQRAPVSDRNESAADAASTSCGANGAFARRPRPTARGGVVAAACGGGGSALSHPHAAVKRPRKRRSVRVCCAIIDACIVVHSVHLARGVYFMHFVCNAIACGGSVLVAIVAYMLLARRPPPPPLPPLCVRV